MANSTLSNTYFCMSLTSIILDRLQQVLVAAAYAILSVVTVVSNLTLIFTLHKTGQLNTISNKLILTMNISDLCLGIITFPTVMIIFAIKDVFQSCLLEKVNTYSVLLFGYFSFLMLTCISLDRYLRITKMNRYSLYMNNFRMKVMILSSVAFANAIAVISLMHPSFEQQIASVLIGSFFMTFLTVVYVFLLRKLRSHIEGMPTGHSNISTVNKPVSSRSEDATRSQLSATKTIQVLLIFMLVSYAPFHIMSAWWTYHKFLKKTEPGKTLDVVYAWSCFVAVFNASGNAWIIIYGNKRCRNYIWSIFRKNRISNCREE